MSIPDDTRYCTSCGQLLPTSALYCPKCGTPTLQGSANPPVELATTADNLIPTAPKQPNVTSGTVATGVMRGLAGCTVVAIGLPILFVIGCIVIVLLIASLPHS